MIRRRPAGIEESNGVLDNGQRHAAGLLGSLQQNTLPPFFPFGRGLLQPALAPLCYDWDDSTDVQFSRFFQQPFEMVELKQACQQGDVGNWRLVGESLGDLEDHRAFPGRCDGSQVKVPVVGDFKLLAFLYPEYPYQVLRRLSG